MFYLAQQRYRVNLLPQNWLFIEVDRQIQFRQ